MAIDKSIIPKTIGGLTGFSDPSGINPLADYHFKPTLNKEAVGEEKISIEVGGGDPAISDLAAFGITDTEKSPEYGSVQVQETKSGHKIVMDDTPDAERVVIGHGKGSGLELKSDGSISIRSKNNMIISIDAHGAMIIDGDLRISSKNLSIDATGDLDLDVAGDFNLKVAGDRKETIYGSDRKEVTGNQGEIVKGSKSATVLGGETNTVLGSYTNIVKGSISNTAEGSASVVAKGAVRVSSQTEYNAAAPSVNMSAGDMSILSSSGTIGGEGVIMYNHNMYTGHHIEVGETVATHSLRSSSIETTYGKATTWEGNLKGVAEFSAGAGVYTGETTVALMAENGKASFMPGVALMKQILSYSNKGISEVQIDEGDYIKNKIDRTSDMGGVANRALTPEEVRAKFKEEAHRENNEFLAAITKDGSISGTFKNGTPPGVGRTSSGRGSVSHVPRGTRNTTAGDGSNKHISSEPRAFQGFKPNAKYDPMAIDPREGVYAINGKTLVAAGIPISTFLGGKGSATNLGHFGTLEERQEAARYLHLQTEVLKLTRSSKQFEKFRIIVAEGIYKPGASEKVSDTSLLGLHKKGRAITYEIFDNQNKIHPETTFELAEYLCEYLTGYDKIVLNYDTLDPREKKNNIHGQVTVVLPEIDYRYELVGKKQPEFAVQTVFNGKTLSDSDLIEVDPYGNVVVEPTPSDDPNGILIYRFTGSRNKKVKPQFERVLAQAARKAGVDQVVIYSGLQPGTRGGRAGTFRHDTGLAADLYLLKDGKRVASNRAGGQQIMKTFVRAAIEGGVRAGGHGPTYMNAARTYGNMHLDMLGRGIGPKPVKKWSGGRDYWKSYGWFSALFEGIPKGPSNSL
jgi:hypothetical protein